MASNTSNRNYHEQVIIKNELKLRELQKQLPRFCGEFFRGRSRERKKGGGHNETFGAVQ